MLYLSRLIDTLGGQAEMNKALFFHSLSAKINMHNNKTKQLCTLLYSTLLVISC